MKIATVGLLSLVLFSCAHQAPVNEPEAPVSELSLKLKQLDSDARLTPFGEHRFGYKKPEQLDLKLFSYQFENQREVKSYLLNRRMLLHRSFQDEIAPYFGVIESDKSCIEKVNTKGDFVEVDQNSEFFKMELPVNANKVMSDCHGEKTWGLVTYLFYNCKKTN
ncbi:MAG: hypothetical protein ACXWQQ_00870 [Pseudobdellovibrio sp.]